MLFRFIIVVGIFSCIACWSAHSIANIYEGRVKCKFGSREILILHEDSTFQYLSYCNEGDYAPSDGLCGHWFLINDSIHFKSFDTVVPKTIYFPDPSDTITIEFFDNYGCKFIWPVRAFYLGLNEDMTIANGKYKSKVNENAEILMVPDGLYNNIIITPIKRDSMRIHIYGLSYSSSKFLEKTALVKEGAKLNGGFWTSGFNRRYVEKRFYPRKKLLYDGLN